MLLPATVAAWALTAKCDAAAALTVIVPLLPVIVPSVPVRVWPPFVVKVALKVPTPATRVLGVGTKVEAPVSVLENVTVPA